MLTMTSPQKSVWWFKDTMTWVWTSTSSCSCLAQDPFWALPIALLGSMVAFVAWHVVWRPFCSEDFQFFPGHGDVKTHPPERKDFDRDVLVSCRPLWLNIPFSITPRLWLNSDESTFVLQNWIQSSSALKGSKFLGHSIHSGNAKVHWSNGTYHVPCCLWPLWPDPLPRFVIGDFGFAIEVGS